jgi:hypothetical protein
MASSDKPVKNAAGRYNNVDFHKAVGYKYPPIKCSYNRRDVLLFVGLRSEVKPLGSTLIEE